VLLETTTLLPLKRFVAVCLQYPLAVETPGLPSVVPLCDDGIGRPLAVTLYHHRLVKAVSRMATVESRYSSGLCITVMMVFQITSSL